MGPTLAAAADTCVAQAGEPEEGADAAMERATSAGATVYSPAQDAFWGGRTGEVLDPSGHRWAFDQRVREVPVEEIEAQLAAMFDGA